MTLQQCTECFHEVAFDAIACPNCGHPIRPLNPAPVVERKVILAQPPDEGGFPTWAFIPIGILAMVLLVLVYVMVQRSDESANSSLNVNVNTSRRASTEPVRETRTTTLPPTTTSQPVAPPSQTSTIPSTTVAPPVVPQDKGTVVLKASVQGTSGPAKNVSGAKFYLLDKDLESILSEAGVRPIEGNSLTGSLGLALVYPGQYGEFQQAAMKALSRHTKKAGTTNASGEANLSGVEPNQYYLFGITRVGRGFALWDQTVSVIAGQNVVNLSPQNITEVDDPNGE